MIVNGRYAVFARGPGKTEPGRAVYGRARAEHAFVADTVTVHRHHGRTNFRWTELWVDGVRTLSAAPEMASFAIIIPAGAWVEVRGEHVGQVPAQFDVMVQGELSLSES